MKIRFAMRAATCLLSGCAGRSRLAVLAALAIGSGEFALGATITPVDSKDGKTRLDLVGDITPGDADAVKFAIQKANGANRVVVTIRLNSKGGNLLESVRIADIIRNGKISTSTPNALQAASLSSPQGTKNSPTTPHRSAFMAHQKGVVGKQLSQMLPQSAWPEL